MKKSIILIVVLGMSGVYSAAQNCNCIQSSLLSQDATTAPCPPRIEQSWSVCGGQKVVHAQGECRRTLCNEGPCQGVLNPPTISPDPEFCEWSVKGENRVHKTFCNTGCKTTSTNTFKKFCAACQSGGGGCLQPRSGSACLPSPILIDVQGREGFELTDAAGGVSFDLDSNGFPERISWTASGADDAFLVLDRNGNGTIDDGTELFGNFTPQPPFRQPNGYRALAVFDRVSEGGNEDGVVNTADAVFSSLRLWLDRNHDGVSQSFELHRLSRYGIVGLELDYATSNRRDEYGNLFRFWSRVYLRDGRTRLSVDVFFLTAGP